MVELLAHCSRTAERRCAISSGISIRRRSTSHTPGISGWQGDKKRREWPRRLCTRAQQSAVFSDRSSAPESLGALVLASARGPDAPDDRHEPVDGVPPKAAMPMMATTVGIPMLAIKPMTARSIVYSVRVSGVPVVTVILPFLSIQAAHTRCSMRIRSRRHQGTSVKSSLASVRD